MTWAEFLAAIEKKAAEKAIERTTWCGHTSTLKGKESFRSA